MNKLKDILAMFLVAAIFLILTHPVRGDDRTEEPPKVQVGDSQKLWAMIFTGNITDDFERIKAAVNVNQPNNKVTVYVKNEWEDIKSYQRNNWQDGKEQLNRNKDQIQGLFSKISDFFKQ